MAPFDHIPDNPYLLLTPGPLSTTKSVRAALLRDWCTWEKDYNDIVQEIRTELVRLATNAEGYTSVLMQGSGTFSVEATIGAAVPRDGKLLVLSNGAYGERIVQMATLMGIDTVVLQAPENERPDLRRLDELLADDPGIRTVAVVHCETTTGMLNDVGAVGEVVQRHARTFVVDAMSSFAGVTLDQDAIGADFLISSANKCIQGVPGFGFVVARREALLATQGNARSLSLDLYGQWQVMEEQSGKWRFTSPTHVVRAFRQALDELREEGGIAARADRYARSQALLTRLMRELGFETFLADKLQSPIITTFLYPPADGFDFFSFYSALKDRGFVIYPGKVSKAETFRVGTIGDVHPGDIERLGEAVKSARFWL